MSDHENDEMGKLLLEASNALEKAMELRRTEMRKHRMKVLETREVISKGLDDDQ